MEEEIFFMGIFLPEISTESAQIPMQSDGKKQDFIVDGKKRWKTPEKRTLSETKEAKIL